MKGAGITDGDYAIIDKSLAPRDGLIAMAYLNGEFTLKRLRVDKETQTVWLLPENSAFEPIKVLPEDEHFKVWGILINVIKSFV